MPLAENEPGHGSASDAPSQRGDIFGVYRKHKIPRVPARLARFSLSQQSGLYRGGHSLKRTHIMLVYIPRTHKRTHARTQAPPSRIKYIKMHVRKHLKQMPSVADRMYASTRSRLTSGCCRCCHASHRWVCARVSTVQMIVIASMCAWTRPLCLRSRRVERACLIAKSFCKHSQRCDTRPVRIRSWTFRNCLLYERCVCDARHADERVRARVECVCVCWYTCTLNVFGVGGLWKWGPPESSSNDRTVGTFIDKYFISEFRHMMLRMYQTNRYHRAGNCCGFSEFSHAANGRHHAKNMQIISARCRW